MAATLSLTNCTEEFQTGPDSVKTSYTIYANAADTKTVNDGLSTKWSENDSLNVFHVESGSSWISDNIKFTLADAATGEFTSDAFDGNLADVNDWFVLYPYNEKIISPSASDEAGYLPLGGRVGRPQIQSGNDSMDHIAGTSYPMWGVAREVSGSEFPHIMMTHLTSLVEVVVSNEGGDPITVTSITFDAPEDITGTYYIGIDGEAPEFVSSGEAYVSDVARLSVKDAEPIEAGSSAKFYFAIKPFTAPAGETLTLTVNGIVKTFELNQDVVFASGKVKTLNFNIEGYVAPEPGPYSSNMVWGLGANAYSETATVNDYEDIPVLKLGKSDGYGAATVMIPAGTSKIGFYAVSWNGKPANLALLKDSEVIGEVYPPVNEGAASNSPYTIYEEEAACYFEIPVNAEEDAEYTFATSVNPRVIIWGLNYYTEDGELGESQEQEEVDVTIPEFLKAEVSERILYRVTGTIVNINEISESYNNATLTIEDEDGNSLYIFRMKPSGEENIAELGLTVGDELTAVGYRGEYKGNPQMVNGYYESHVDGEEPEPAPEVVPGPYTSNLEWTLGESAYSESATINGEEGIDVLKVGTSKKVGSATVSVPAGTTKIGFYAVSWKAKAATVAVMLGDEVVGTADAPANDGASDNSPYTIDVEDASCYFEVVVNAEDATEYTLTTNSSNKRAIIWGVNYYTEDGIGDGEVEEPEPEPSEPVVATVAEVLAAEVSTTVWYQMTGKVTNLVNTIYGNFDLVDETGSIYVYGLTATQVEKNDKSFASLGIQEGDIVTIIGKRSEYKESPQVGGAYYVSHEAGEEPEPEPDPDRITIDNGDYWIIADGNVATPLAEDKTYGYLGVVDAVDNASTAANAFTFTHSGDGLYTIQDSYGRYVYQTGTYNSFNVSAELGEDNGYYWTLSMSDEAYVIMNYGVSKFIQYDASYNSYGSYPDARAVLPTLVLADNPVESEPVEPEDPEVGETTSYTLTFADKSYRTEFTTEMQVWSQNGVILTNEKASSTNNVADYANPLRMYQGSSVAVSMEDGSLISKIEFTCNAAKYVTALQNSINTATTADGNIVTVVFETPVDVYSIEALTAQVRLNSLTVYID